MIQNKELTDVPWRVFQWGHTGWWWTTGRGRVSSHSYPTEADATAARDAFRKIVEGLDEALR